MLFTTVWGPLQQLSQFPNVVGASQDLEKVGDPVVKIVNDFDGSRRLGKKYRSAAEIRLNPSEADVLSAALSCTSGAKNISFDLKVRCPACHGEYAVSTKTPHLVWADLFKWMQQLYATVSQPLPSNEEGPQRPLSLKEVNLLDVVPGRADAPGVGEQIAIISTECRDEIEQPFMLNMRDSQKLAVELMCILAHHGDETAKQVIAQHFTDRDAG